MAFYLIEDWFYGFINRNGWNWSYVTPVISGMMYTIFSEQNRNGTLGLGDTWTDKNIAFNMLKVN